MKKIFLQAKGILRQPTIAMSGWSGVATSPPDFRIRELRRSRELKMIKKFMQEEEGATAIEYGLIAALIAVVIISALIAVGSSLDSTFDNINSAVDSARTTSS